MSNGNYTVFDVPIFSAHSEELRNGKKRVFSKEWLSKAVDKALLRQSEGYMPPLHISHHGSDSVEATGQIRINRLGKVKHDGELVPTIFADLVNVKPETYERIKLGQLVYRSVEIIDIDKPEIDSLALLDHETPFFRFPLLRVQDSESVVSVSNTGPVLAYTQSGHSSRALFNYQSSENIMKQEAEMTVDKKADQAEVLKQLLEALTALKALLEPKVEEEAEEEAEAAPEQDMPTPSEQPESMAKQAAEAEGTNAALFARMSAMEEELKTLRSEKQIEKKAAELTTAGFGADQINAFRAKAKQEGLEVANAYAAGMERIGPSDPPSHWTGEITTEEPDCPEVSAFAAQGPEALAKARDLYASWKRSNSEVPFNEYVAINIDPDAYCGLSR